MPLAGVLVLQVGGYLPRRTFGHAHGRGRNTSDTYIHSSADIRHAFVIIQEAEVVIRSVGFGLHLAVHRLISEQGVWSGGRHQFAVVVTAVAEQQEPAWLLHAARTAVVEHLHQPAVSRSVRSA